MARLQATYRARVLALKYLTLRERMKVFQAFCRGFLARVEYKNRLQSIIKIQSGIRMVLAKRRTEELRIEVGGSLEFPYLIHACSFNTSAFENGA